MRSFEKRYSAQQRTVVFVKAVTKEFDKLGQSNSKEEDVRCPQDDTKIVDRSLGLCLWAEIENARDIETRSVNIKDSHK